MLSAFSWYLVLNQSITIHPVGNKSRIYLLCQRHFTQNHNVNLQQDRQSGDHQSEWDTSSENYECAKDFDDPSSI